MGNFARDLHFTLRTLRKNPGFATIAVLALALGIGINSSIFSLYNAVALRPLPVKDPGRVIRLFRTTRGELGAGVFSYPQYADFRDRGGVLCDLAAWAWTGLSMGPGGWAEDVSAMFVSGNYFDVLGADVAVGRTFTSEEDRTVDMHPVVVVSHKLWERRYGRDPAVVGRSILLNGRAFTVVGVVARNFVGTDAVAPEAWVLIGMRATLAPGANDLLRDRDGHWLQVIGRLKPGVSRSKARAGLEVVAAQLGESHPDERNSSVALAGGTFIPPNAAKAATPIVILAMGAVGLVLLIACTNVANLMLARATARRKEIGIRLSLGATRGHLMRQLLTESLVIAVLGGLMGLTMASWASRVLLGIASPPFAGALNFDVSPDIRVLGYTFAVSLATILVFGLVPALSASKTEMNEWIKTAMLPRRRTWASDSFVVAQVGLCVVLLVAGGLLLRALRRAQNTDPGFDIKHLIAVSLNLRLHRYDERTAIAFEKRVADRLRSLPGVKTVSLAATAPLGTAFMDTGVIIEGRDIRPDLPPLIVGENMVSPEFFETLGIPILRGRGFGGSDWTTGTETVMVNEAMASRFWPGLDPIGKRLKAGDAKSGWREIIGVVKNTRSSHLWADDQPYLYIPAKVGASPVGDMKLLVRTAGAPDRLTGVVAGVVRDMDSSVQVSSKPLEENLETWIWPSRVGALLAAAFGSLALILAAIGIYGVVSYTVSRRTREIGIHVALGAQSRHVLQMVLRHGMLLVGIGVASGFAGGFALARVITGYLYGLSPNDPVTFAGVGAMLGAVALLAHYVPARRALRVDAIVALRSE
jgi:predicted permease